MAFEGITPAAGGPTALDWIRAGSSVAGALRAAPAGPSMAQGTLYGGDVSLAFDNSGWTVATSGSRASAERTQGAAPSILIYAALGVGAILLWRKLRS